jgi:hypothetical protein
MSDEEGRKRRLAREYLACTPILEVAVQQVLRRATHIAPEARQRLAESRPGLRRDVDQVVFNLLVEHFTIEELNHQVQWMTSRLGRSWLDKQPAFWAGIGDAIQPLVHRAIGDIRGAERGA